jgi:hypothetical protein
VHRHTKFHLTGLLSAMCTIYPVQEDQVAQSCLWSNPFTSLMSESLASHIVGGIEFSILHFALFISKTHGKPPMILVALTGDSVSDPYYWVSYVVDLIWTYEKNISSITSICSLILAILYFLSSDDSYTGIRMSTLTKFLSLDIKGSIDCEPIEKTDLNRNTRIWSFKKGKS